MFLHNVGSMLSIGVETFLKVKFWDTFQNSCDKVSFLSHLIQQPLQLNMSQMPFFLICESLRPSPVRGGSLNWIFMEIFWWFNTRRKWNVSSQKDAGNYEFWEILNNFELMQQTFLNILAIKNLFRAVRIFWRRTTNCGQVDFSVCQLSWSKTVLSCQVLGPQVIMIISWQYSRINRTYNNINIECNKVVSTSHA